MPVAHGETSVAMMRIYGAPRRLSGSVDMKSSDRPSSFPLSAALPSRALPEHRLRDALTKLLRMDKGPA